MCDCLCVSVCEPHLAWLSWWVFFLRLMNNKSELGEEYRARREEEEKGGGGEGRGNDYQMVFNYCATAATAAAISLKENTLQCENLHT